MHTATADPQMLLPNYDLVFGLGRSAMEAMATGTAVVLWGLEGLGGFVHRGNFETLLSRNFGRETLIRADAEAVAVAIGAVDRDEAAWVRDHLRKTYSLDWMVAGYLDAYEEIIQEAAAQPVDLSVTLRAASDYLVACVPKVQVDSLLGRRASRSGRRIRTLVDLLVVGAAAALVLLGCTLAPWVAGGPLGLKVSLVALGFGLVAGLVNLRSWLRAKSGFLAGQSWRRLLALS
jgi:hypothetical protein